MSDKVKLIEGDIVLREGKPAAVVIGRSIQDGVTVMCAYPVNKGLARTHYDSFNSETDDYKLGTADVDIPEQEYWRVRNEDHSIVLLYF